jgi:hypothetical protein
MDSGFGSNSVVVSNSDTLTFHSIDWHFGLQSKHDTTLKYYLAVKDDLVDRATRAVRHRVSREMLERWGG